MTTSAYDQSSTHWYWEELRKVAEPLPAEMSSSDHLMTGTIIRKRAFRKLTWSVLDEIWTQISERRSLYPETGGLLFERNKEVEPEFFATTFGTGRFGLCVRIAASMCLTLRNVSLTLREQESWAKTYAELDEEVAEMSYELRLKHLERNEPSKAEQARAFRAEGKTIEEIFGSKLDFERFVIDEIESPFRIYAGLTMFLLEQDPKLPLERVALILNNSAPLVRDWANQSLAAFEETRMAQGCVTPTTAKYYPDCFLPKPGCYKIAEQESEEARLEFSDGFIAAQLEPMKAAIREHSPYRIGCGGLRKTAVAENLDFVTDSLRWFVEILQAHGERIDQLKTDY